MNSAAYEKYVRLRVQRDRALKGLLSRPVGTWKKRALAQVAATDNLIRAAISALDYADFKRVFNVDRVKSIAEATPVETAHRMKTAEEIVNAWVREAH